MNKRDLRRLKGVLPRLVIVFYEAQQRSSYTFHVGYLGGRRTSREQHELFKKKKSQKDGYNKLSKHQTGRAVDFVIYENGKATWEHSKYWSVAKLMMGISLELFGVPLRSGGDWNQNGIPVNEDPNEKFADYGHIEI